MTVSKSSRGGHRHTLHVAPTGPMTSARLLLRFRISSGVRTTHEGVPQQLAALDISGAPGRPAATLPQIRVHGSQRVAGEQLLTIIADAQPQCQRRPPSPSRYRNRLDGDKTADRRNTSSRGDGDAVRRAQRFWARPIAGAAAGQVAAVLDRAELESYTVDDVLEDESSPSKPTVTKEDQ